ATIKILTLVLSSINLREAVREKSVSADTAQDTSYSRVAGMVGACVMATFFWAAGNVILYSPLNHVDISGFMQNIGTFIPAGAALFLPYGFNQLREAFAPRK